MDHREVGQYWNENAEVWTQLVRKGHDVARDLINTPAFFDLLPSISDKIGLDLGCGEGHNTRLLAQQGAHVTALDFSDVFIGHARSHEVTSPLGIRHLRASSVQLPFPQNTFDFATAFMSLMEFPETGEALAEVFRVLKPGGFLQFSITHPCFNTITRENMRDENGQYVSVQLGEYFAPTNGEIEEWMFSCAPEEERRGLRKFRVPDFRSTFSEWVNLLITNGFQIQAIAEPCPSEEAIAQHPSLQSGRIAPFFLHFRVGK